jgi:hypothetical protein
MHLRPPALILLRNMSSLLTVPDNTVERQSGTPNRNHRRGGLIVAGQDAVNAAFAEPGCEASGNGRLSGGWRAG